MAAIKTIPDKDITWDTVSARLIEDWKDLPKSNEEANERSLTARVNCDFCGRFGHDEHDCKFKKIYLKRQSDNSDNDSSDSKRRPKVRDA